MESPLSADWLSAYRRFAADLALADADTIERVIDDGLASIASVLRTDGQEIAPASVADSESLAEVAQVSVSALIEAARERIGLETESRARSERQAFLNSISAMAAQASIDSSLDEILEVVLEHLDLLAVSVWALDGNLLTLDTAAFAPTDSAAQPQPLPRARLSDEQIESMVADGHLVTDVDQWSEPARAMYPHSSSSLVVPLIGPSGPEGILALIDASRSSWDRVDLEGAQSIGRSIQKLWQRWRAESIADFQLASEEMLHRVARIAGGSEFMTGAEVAASVLPEAVRLFELMGASYWAANDTGDGFVRRFGVESTGKRSEISAFLAATPEVRGAVSAAEPLSVRLCEVVSGHEVQSNAYALLVPVGRGARHGLVALVSDGLLDWSSGHVTVARSFAVLLDQAFHRLEIAASVEERVELEALAQRAASIAVKARLDNIDECIEQILRELVQHFEVAEAQLWRVEVNARSLRASVRPDGLEVPLGTRVPFVFTESVTTQGWAEERLGGLPDLIPGVRPDPPDSKVLFMFYSGPEGPLGMLTLVDPSCRRWSDDELNALRNIADVTGQMRSRMVIAEALDHQRGAERFMTNAAAAFVDSTLETANDVVEQEFEKLRVHVDCASLTVLALDHDALELECPCEVNPDGELSLRDMAPFPRDHPAIARLLDPEEGPRFRFGDLFGEDRGDPNRGVLAFPTVRGRDILILVAVEHAERSCSEEAIASLAAMRGLLAQLRSRMLVERRDQRREIGDRALARIAADFVDRSLDDAREGIVDALEAIMEATGADVACQWRFTDDGGIDREYAVATDHSVATTIGPAGLVADDPVVERLRLIEEAQTVEIHGPTAPQGVLEGETLAVAPLSFGEAGDGGLALAWRRAAPLVVDLDVYVDLLESLGSLVRQLYRRLRADRAIGLRLASEDLLRQFATRLVMTQSGQTDGTEQALRWLVEQFGIDHASVWRSEVLGSFATVEMRVQTHAETLGIAPHFQQFSSSVDHEQFVSFRALPSGEWSADDPNNRIADIVHALGGESPRRLIVTKDGNVDDPVMMHLIASRGGSEPLGDHVSAMLTSALSILAQHEARVAAERSLTTAFASAPVAISLRSADGRLLECNQAYCDLIGRSEEELLGTPVSLVVSPEHLDENLEVLRAAGSTTTIETALRRSDGAVVWVSMRTARVKIPGHGGLVNISYAEDITDRRRSRQLLEYQATHDELTGLPNRRAFVGDVAKELAYTNAFAVLMLDLDRFKVVNDSLGHSAGDQLLITCADRIRLSLRPGDAVCRIGGDEFAILLRSPADAAAAGIVASRLLGLLSEPVRVSGEEVFPSASIGIAIPNDGDNVEDLLRHADAAMYQAKGQGRDRWVQFDASMREAVAERIRTETDLRRAIENGQLEVHYQPEFILDSGEIVGAEALVRWRHPERGMLAAGAFIGLAEESGLVVDIGRWVLGEATAQAAAWMQAGRDFIMRVNLSARQLRPAIVDEVKDALLRAGLPSNRLCLELTETAIMNDVAESAEILQQFRDLGVQVAIDDFGTGFSSLSYLKRLPVDILKIDRTFVDGVGVDGDDTAIVRAVISLARTLRLEVVAEGIETPEQVIELVRLGCNRGQGYHLARPAPPAEVALMLEPNNL